MTPDDAAYLKEIEAALADADEQALLSAVSNLIQENPIQAGLLLWSKFSSVEDAYFRRVLAYTLAKTAARSRYLWGPLAEFVNSAISDEATLTNVLTALQLYDDPDEVLTAVLGPDFGAFTIRCIESGPLALEGLCELLLSLAERDGLANFLTRAQVDVVKERLSNASERHKPAEADATMIVLRRLTFPETLKDRTERLNVEEAALVSDQTIEELVAAQLRSVLANARSKYVLRRQAEEAQGVIEEITLDGGDATQGRLVVDTLEKLIHHWKTAIRESVSSLAPNLVPSMTTYVLAPARGSFVLQFLVQARELDVVSRSFDEIARVAENPEELPLASHLSSETKSQIVQFLDVLAQKKLDATLGLIDPHRFEKPRRRVLAKKIAPVLKKLRETKTETAIRHETAGTLEGASHRQGTFEIQTETLGAIRGDVPAGRRSLLLRKIIGERYQFVLQETVTTGLPGEDKKQWTLVSIDGGEHVEAAELAPPKPEPKELTTEDVPQQDLLDRIVAVVRLVAAEEELHPKKLGMANTASSRRHIDYMRQGAKVLGLLSHDGTLTPAGRTLAQLPESRVLDFLSVRFEVSVVGRLWKRRAKVRDLHQLDPESAEEFLLAHGLSESMAERRGRTLRKWLIAFQSLRK